MFNPKIYLTTAIAFLFLAVGIHSASAACQAEVSVVVNDYNTQMIKGARFSIFEQVVDAQGNPTAGKLLGGNTTDKNTGIGKVTVNLTEGLNKYVVKAVNPAAEGFDFWYFDKMSLFCDQKLTFIANLSAIKLKVSDYQGLLQKNVKFTIFAQGRDANGEPIIGKQVGGGDTGVTGEKIIYLPDPVKTIGLGANYYLLEVKNTKGDKFYKYNISPADGELMEINYRFSEMVVKAKDATTGSPLPNLKLNMYVRLPAELGGYKAGKMITTIQTNEDGTAYLQYPAGQYMLEYTKASGEKVPFFDIEIINNERREFDLSIDDYVQARCNIKSSLSVGFRDFDSKIIGNINFNIYEQKLDDDGSPVVGGKVSSGHVDNYGLAKIDFYPQPAKQYLMEVCDKSPKFGCFWFDNINFECKDDITIKQDLKSIDVILRDSKGKLVPGQKFKIYVKQKDVDGRTVIDKAKMVGSFTEPQSGVFRMYLDNSQLDGSPIEYLLAVDYNRKEVFTEFSVSNSAKTTLEYIIGDPLKAIRKTTVANGNYSGIIGRIVIQVEGKGEAWYINPNDKKRYYLGRPEDAFLVMKKLSVGASNSTLAKIRPNVDILSATDVDSDNDKLADVLEKGLLTNPQSADSDGDGYADYTEVKSGFNPKGAGKMVLDDKFAAKNSGRILLQVEGNGEAWYINPLNKQRYYLSRPKDAFAIMRTLGLGITNANLEKIPVGQ